MLLFQIGNHASVSSYLISPSSSPLRRSPAQRGDSRGDLAAPPRPISARRLLLADSVARCRLLFARAHEVLVCSALAPLVCVGVASIREATSSLCPALSLCVASPSPNRLLAPRLPLLEVWRYLRSPLCSLDIKFVALFSCCCVDICSSSMP